MGIPLEVITPSQIGFYDATSAIPTPTIVGDGLVEFGGAGAVVTQKKGKFRVTVRALISFSAVTVGMHLGIAFGYGAVPAQNADASLAPNYTTGQSEVGMVTAQWDNPTNTAIKVVASVSVVIDATSDCWIDYVLGNEAIGGLNNVELNGVQFEVERLFQEGLTVPGNPFTTNVN